MPEPTKLREAAESQHAPGEPRPVPNVERLEPPTAAVGDPDIELHVWGDHFGDNTMITFNRVNCSTEVHSDNEVSTTVKLSDYSTPTNYPVTVKDGAFESNSVDFVLTPTLTEAEKKARDDLAKKAPHLTVPKGPQPTVPPQHAEATKPRPTVPPQKAEEKHESKPEHDPKHDPKHDQKHTPDHYPNTKK